MLTRIEIDGFRSFLDFTLDVPPFLALVGPNSSGKSNLLDALAFARSAVLARDPARFSEDDPLLNARRGKPQEVFHQPVGHGPVDHFKIDLSADTGSDGNWRKIDARVEASREQARWGVTVRPARADQKVWPGE
ncbi:AAA family ATPase [Nonomuraea sp. B12E4]|uniref:AAA family ATPase n=1 Tax=Nonomuraea sp. B12E4 TaxID=3153564 RepID=UPI00325F7427